MFHYLNAITNTKGDALIGYYVKVVDTSTGSLVPLYADENSTPIFSVSGLANAAKVNSDGMADFYVASGTYHLDIYATNGTTLAKRLQNVPLLAPAEETVTLRPESFGATVYDPANEVDSTAALQAFFDHAADPQNARAHVYDWSGEWMVSNTIYAAYWDSGEPNVDRRFVCGTLRVPPLASLPGGVALAYVMEIAGMRQRWDGVLGIHETGLVNQYNNTTYATRRFTRGVHIRCFGNSTIGDIAVDGAIRDGVHLEGWEAGFTVNGIVFPQANSIACKIGSAIGRFCGSGDQWATNQAPSPLTISAVTHGNGSGTLWSNTEAFAAVTAGYENADAQRSKLTTSGTTADLAINDLIWGRVELTPAIYGTIAATADADPTTGTFVWSAGNPTDLDGSGHGLAVGDIYPIFQAGPNLGIEFVITGFSGTSNRTIAVARNDIYNTTIVVTAHAATADATYKQYGPKSWHWVSRVIDSTHFTVTPWYPSRLNSQVRIVHGAALKCEGDDLANVTVGTVYGLICGGAYYHRGNFAPTVATVLGESCNVTLRIGDQSYGGGNGTVIKHGHSEGCLLDLLTAGGVNGSIAMPSNFDLAKVLAYSPRASTNDIAASTPRNLGALQLTTMDGTVHDYQNGGVRESASGQNFVSNGKIYRHLFLDGSQTPIEVRYDSTEADRLVKNHWAEITVTDTSGRALGGSITFTLSKKMQAQGWTFAGGASGTSFAAPVGNQSYKLRLLYMAGTKKVGVQRSQYFLDELGDFRTPNSVYIGEYSGGAGYVDNKELVLRNSSGYGLRVAMNGATSQLYLQNVKPFVGYSEFHIEGSPIILSGDGGSTATLTLSGTGGAVIGTLSATSTVSGSNLTTGGFPASVATATIIGRSTAGTGAASALTTIPTGTVPAFAGGDVTSAGGSLVLTIPSNTVTFAKFQQLPTVSLVGNSTGGTANAQSVTLAADHAFSGTTLQLGAFTGDVAKSAGALATTVAAKGSSGNLQYNNATVRAGAANLNVDASGNLAVAYASATTTPAADSLSFVPQRLLASGGRVLPRFQDETGVLSTMQPHLGRNGIAWMQGTGSTTPTISGINMTASGTATSRVPATTNRLTRTRRLQYLSSASVGSSGGLYSGSLSAYSLGSGTVIAGGGFLAVFRWGASDPATVAGAHMFVGMQNSIAAPAAATDPSTLTNIVGVAQLNGGANLNIVYGGSAAQTAIDLGASFPAAGASTDLYELILYAPPTLNNTVYYRVERVNTGDVASGTLTGTAGTVLPSNSTLLGPRLWRSNNATALAVGIDIAGFTVESDF